MRSCLFLILINVYHAALVCGSLCVKTLPFIATVTISSLDGHRNHFLLVLQQSSNCSTCVLDSSKEAILESAKCTLIIFQSQSSSWRRKPQQHCISRWPLQPTRKGCGDFTGYRHSTGTSVSWDGRPPRNFRYGRYHARSQGQMHSECETLETK